MIVTAATVRRDYLEPALDARAHNLHQERLVYDPSPEIDSLAEHLVALRRTTDGPAVAGLLRQLVQSNTAEGDVERTIARAADQLVTDLRTIELNGPPAGLTVTAKGIARQLRTPLRELREPGGLPAARFVAAVRTIDRAIATVPRAQLLAPAVAHELGAASFRLLTDLAQKGAAETTSPDGAETHRAGDGHATV